MAQECGSLELGALLFPCLKPEEKRSDFNWHQGNLLQEVSNLPGEETGCKPPPHFQHCRLQRAQPMPGGWNELEREVAVQRRRM